MGLALKGIGALANGATNLLDTGAARTAVATAPLYAAAASSLFGGNKQNSLGTSSSTTLASTPPVKTAVAATPPPAAPPPDGAFDFAGLNQKLNDNQRMMSDWAYSMQAQQDSFNRQSTDSLNALAAQAAAEKEQLRQKTQYRSTSGGYFGSSRRTLVGG